MRTTPLVATQLMLILESNLTCGGCSVPRNSVNISATRHGTVDSGADHAIRKPQSPGPTDARAHARPGSHLCLRRAERGGATASPHRMRMPDCWHGPRLSQPCWDMRLFRDCEQLLRGNSSGRTLLQASRAAGHCRGTRPQLPAAYCRTKLHPRLRPRTLLNASPQAPAPERASLWLTLPRCPKPCLLVHGHCRAPVGRMRA